MSLSGPSLPLNKTIDLHAFDIAVDLKQIRKEDRALWVAELLTHLDDTSYEAVVAFVDKERSK